MDRKVKTFLSIFMLSLTFLTFSSERAKAYDIYSSPPSESVTHVFRDIVSKINLADDYVYFRADENVYYLVSGDLTFDEGSFSLAENGKIYSVFIDDSEYTYSVSDINEFSLSVSNELIYSNLGGYPDLIGYESKYEIFQTIIMLVALLCCLIFRIFPRSKCK